MNVSETPEDGRQHRGARHHLTKRIDEGHADELEEGEDGGRREAGVVGAAGGDVGRCAGLQLLAVSRRHDELGEREEGDDVDALRKAVTGRPVFCASASLQCEEEVSEKVHGGDAGEELRAEHLRIEAARLGEQFVEQQELDPRAEQLAEQAVDVAAGKEADGLFDFRRASGCASTFRDSTTIAECDHPHAAVSTREPAGAAATRAATPSAMSAQRPMSLRRRRARGSLRRAAARGASAAGTGGRRRRASAGSARPRRPTPTRRPRRVPTHRPSHRRRERASGGHRGRARRPRRRRQS